MRGYIIRMMQLGKDYQPPREVEIVTPKEDLVDLIFSIGRLPDRSGYWDVFYVEGEPQPETSMTLDENYAAMNGVAARIQYVLTHGSLIFTSEGYTLYQRFGSTPKDIPF
jgi:hypothetical protein